MGEDNVVTLMSPIFIVGPDGESMQWNGVKSVTTFAETNGDEFEQKTFSLRPIEFRADVFFSRATRKRLILMSYGWTAKGHVRKRLLKKTVIAMGYCNLSNMSDEVFEHWARVLIPKVHRLITT